MTYSVMSLLNNHCCELHCFFNGQSGGWEIETVPNKYLNRINFRGRNLEEAMTKAAKHYLDKEN